MKRILGFLMALMICLGVFTFVDSQDVYAATSGTCTYTINNGVLTISPADGVSGTLNSFTYPNLINSLTSVTYAASGVPWAGNKNITKIVIKPGVKTAEGCNYLFAGMDNLTTIEGLSNLDTSNATSFMHMFASSSKLTTLDLSSWNTSNVTNMDSMFMLCYGLTTLDVSDWDTSKVTTLADTFHACWNLPSLDLSSWDVGNVKKMYNTFEGCRNLISLNLSSWNLGDVAFLSTFKDCSKLESLDLASWHTCYPTHISYMFDGCSSLKSLDLSKIDTRKCGSFYNMFNNCSSLKSLDLSHFDTGNVTDMDGMFSGCSSLESINLSRFDTRNVSNMNRQRDKAFNKMFTGDTSLKEIWLSAGFDIHGYGLTSLPAPPSTAPYVGKWVRDDGSAGPYTPEQLSASYKGSTMAGKWVWALTPCAVFSEDGTLYFVRPVDDTVDVSDSSGTVTSISGEQFTGRIFTVNESTGNATWQSIASQVKKVQVVDEIKPVSINSWFLGFDNCTDFDLAKLNTSEVTNMYRAFYGCSAVETLDLAEWDTSSVTNMVDMFRECSKLEFLDISNFDTSSVVDQGFNGFGTSRMFFHSNPKTMVIGPNLFAGVSKSYDIPMSYPSSTAPYTGKWIREDQTYGPYTCAELMANYSEAMAGTWIWEVRQDPNGYVVFDANGGGFTTADIKITFTESEGVHPFTTLGEDVTQWPSEPKHFLLGWSEDKAATEPTYESDTEINIGELEKTKTLYAVWTADGVTRYHVKHYQQAYDLSGYTLTETERLYGQAEAEVTPDVKTYEGFAQPSTKTVTLAADGSTEVEYKYDRLQYRIHFDGNTATAGSMSDMRMLMGVGGQLRSNAFRKTGAIFTGWNTAADGSGTTYTDKANVVDLTNEHGSTVTLYAQWLENTNPAVTPTNGAVRVTLKQGQTVVIPDLPAGTSYTIREVSNPAGWEWKSTDGETGTITANQTNDATVHNVYHAVGSIPFEIYKVLEDGLSGENKPIEAGKFTFALVDASDMRIMVASNEATDTDETIFNAAGEEVPNPNYGKALVSFDTIEYDESDIGKTYTYYISEINTPEGYEASESVKVTVSIADAGKGQLDVTASYDHNQEIKNTDKTGGFLEIKKLVSGSAPEGAEFTFKVDLSDADGRTYAESVSGVKSDESTLSITSGESITLKADESATFRLPAGVTYKVSEETADGWTLVQSSGESGAIVSGETAHAVFTNAYDVEGIVSITATKNLVGKELTAGEFEFVLEDADGNIVSQATNDAEGNIAFNIPYTTEDVGKSYTYTAHEVIPDETFGITYDKTVFTVSVDVSAENGKLTGSVNIADHDSIVFNNTYAASTDITVSGKKVLTGRDFRDTDKWTFTLDGEGPKPAETSVEIYPARGDEFSFTIPFNVSDMDGQRTKEFTYTVTESGFVPLVANDTSVKSFTVRVTDEGTGVMKAEIVDADNLDLTFTNRALVTLPMTGSMTSIWIMLAGLLVIAAGYAYSRKRKGNLAE